jgi:hypothetical protein
MEHANGTMPSVATVANTDAARPEHSEVFTITPFCLESARA